MRTADKYIIKYYRSRQVARRIHYILRNEEYIDYDGEVYNIEIFYYGYGASRVKIWDEDMKEILHEGPQR